MNPFVYYKNPTTAKEAQSCINYFWYEGLLTDSEIDDLGHIPASYRTYIKEMTREFTRIKSSIQNKES